MTVTLDRETLARLGAMLAGSALVVGFLAWVLLGPRYECTQTTTIHVPEEPAHPTLHTGIDPMTGQLHTTVGLDPGHPAYDYTKCVAWRRLEDWER